MTFANVVPSLIRTYVPIAVGALLSWLVTTGIIPTPLGPDAEAGLVTAITAIGIGLYYTAVRLAERKWPKVGILLGTTAQPHYGKGGYVIGQLAALPGAHRDDDGDGIADGARRYGP